MKSGNEVDFQSAEGDSSAEQTVTHLVQQAAAMPASDLFFQSNEDDVIVSVRHLGVMRELTRLSPLTGRRVMNYIKTMANLDLTERRHPQDGRWIYEGRDGAKLDLRINTLPTLHGEDFALRLLSRDDTLNQLDRLGLLRSQRNDVTAMLDSPSGLILVTGPTGAGKTTTLYSCIHRLNDGKRKINTIEDPVEYEVEGVRQSAVSLATDIDFPELLRSVLRQSPDVIMIGEIRDSITAQTAIRAANSGLLVLATLHAGVTSTAIQSMFAFDVKPHFLAFCLRGIITQRLVRVLCERCRVAIDISDAPLVFEEVKSWLGSGEGARIYSPKGCPECHHTGYRDRSGVFEVMTIGQNIRQMVSDVRPAADIHRAAIDAGMLEFRRVGLVKVAEGVTTTEEILRVLPVEQLGLEG